jgi:simple sugar transport system ATP-binding protein
MVGSEVREPSRAAGGRSVGQVRFAVSNLSLAPAEAHGIPLRDISLELRAGEVLGVAGVAGNGQGELLAALSGERTGAPDAIRLDGRPVGNLGPAARRGLGLCYVPEERNGHGAVGPLSLIDNALLSGWKRKRFARGGLIGRSRVAAFAREVVKRFDVRTAGVTHAASSLSGGNLQKFIVGREVMQDPDVLVVAQPTWGVDAAAAASIHQALLDLAAGGAAVLVISQDLDELFTLSDRIAVINAGRLSPAVPAAQATVEQVGLMMGGLHEAATPKVHAHAA